MLTAPRFDIFESLRSSLALSSQVDWSAYCDNVYKARAELLETDYWAPIQYRLENLAPVDKSSTRLDLSSSIKISVDEYPESSVKLVHKTIDELIPWRKGPFSLLGREIDAEWRSDIKWDRVKDAVGELSNRKVVDIGCNNGYYLFRMLAEQPECLLGVDPGPRFIYQYKLLNHFIQAERCMVEPLGIEHLDVFTRLFDVVLCMGVLYHRRGQYESLELLHKILRNRGKLLLETLIVGGDTPYCLCPPERYAMMRNVWFLPSRTVLIGWLKQVGFRKVEIVAENWVEPSEQRQTPFAPFKSLDHFLDPEDKRKTVEGFPAPRRIALLAER